MGFSVATIHSANGDSRAIIDSGASLSYVPEEIVAGLEPTGMRQDFYPGFGEFETNTWRLRAAIGGRRFSMTVGVLPPMLKMMLGFVIGADGWIVGNDFFRGRVMAIDYANARLLDITP